MTLSCATSAGHAASVPAASRTDHPEAESANSAGAESTYALPDVGTVSSATMQPIVTRRR
jgi:hypothetical protein